MMTRRPRPPSLKAVVTLVLIATVAPVVHSLIVPGLASLAPLRVVVDAVAAMGPDAVGAVALAAGAGGGSLDAQLNHRVFAQVAPAVGAGPHLLVFLAHDGRGLFVSGSD
ncbi:hypothetical protein PG996_000193 [Apiospora saccharicola]|uniref:Uncharacterized protein n=1 Tax=Apiospora saccharicola TaxID=335842 RepID=A0ABR1WEH1_9PEZI